MKIMAIDYGDAHTGIAVSDALLTLAGFTTVITAYRPEAVAAEVQNLIAEHGVTEREMMRARGQLRGAMVLGGEDSLARMGRLGRAEVVTGRLRSMGENLRRLEAVTPEEVREMAAWLVEQKRARILVGPVD